MFLGRLAMPSTATSEPLFYVVELTKCLDCLLLLQSVTILCATKQEIISPIIVRHHFNQNPFVSKIEINIIVNNLIYLTYLVLMTNTKVCINNHMCNGFKNFLRVY